MQSETGASDALRSRLFGTNFAGDELKHRVRETIAAAELLDEFNGTR